MATNPDWKPVSDEELAKRFVVVTAMKVDDQVFEFLKSFVNVFKGNFEEVLELVEEFVKSAPAGTNREALKDLDEFDAHRFLERRDESLTVKELREAILVMDLDRNRRVAFVEYALWKYQRDRGEKFVNLQLLVNPNIVLGGDDAVIREAIRKHAEVVRERKKREDEMAALQATINATPDSVKGKAAAARLAQMKSEDTLELKKREITAEAAKRKAEKNAVDPFAEEQKRLEADKKAKEEEEKQKREAARANLKAKASLWQNK